MTDKDRMMTDEDRMMQKLKEHKDMNMLIKKIGIVNDIDIVLTINNDPKGDFTFPLEKKEALVKALDEHLLHRKYSKKGEEF